VVVAPSLDAEAKVRLFKAKHKIEYPLLAGANASANSYLVPSYPFLTLIGKDRKVIWRANFKDAKLEDAIVAALKAPTPEGAKAPAAGGGGEGSVPVYVLKDGTRINAVKVMDAGEEYSIKDENGKFRAVKKTDVSEIIK
jgi:hypothetical protein